MSELLLLELKERALNCRLCDLAEKRTNVVFGEGNIRSPLVLIGEGPGEHEDLSGRPFVGKAGKMLDAAIAEAGLERNALYITNTVKCRAADWETGKPKNRAPTRLEAASCRTWLEPQLQKLAPKAILCIGSPSAHQIIGKHVKISQDRGRVFHADSSLSIKGEAIKAVPTLHPSYIQRRAAMNRDDGGFSLLVADLKLAWELATSNCEY